MQTRPDKCEASPLHGLPHGAIPAAADVFINAWCAVNFCDVLPVVRGRVILGLEVLLVQSAVELLSCDCDEQWCNTGSRCCTLRASPEERVSILAGHDHPCHARRSNW